MKHVLIPCADLNWMSELRLPAASNNIFGRIIRHPYSNARNPKERECTEMLCALLRNASIVQQRLLNYFAHILGQSGPDMEDLRFEFQTEQSIGLKRDDLRIMGWRERGDESELTVLWTIEVKVGASFHQSSSIIEQDIGSEDDVTIVNQVTNYDHWLAGETAEYRGGIVLALTDSSRSLPDGLRCKWACTSWTRLGECIGIALDEPKIPDGERFLAKHVLGFIRNYLWRESEMETTEIGFDDIALLRAFTDFGLDLEKKVDGLVSGLISVMEEHGYAKGAVVHQKSLYKAMGRSILYTSFLGLPELTYPQLMMGFTKSGFSLWLETAPTNNLKPQITGLVETVLPELQERNPGWMKLELPWTDLSIAMPLQSLLVSDDQEAFFLEFFRDAMSDLKSVSLTTKIASLQEP